MTHMVIIYFFLVISLLWLIFATVTDIKKREVPDWLSYSLIGIGLGTRLIYSLMYNEYSFILYGLAGLFICLLFGNLMYYTKQWGGGDAKLLMGLGALFADYRIIYASFNIPFLLILIINIFFAGSIYGIIYSAYLAIKNKDKFMKKWRERKQHGLLLAGAFGILMAIVSYFLFDGFYQIFGIVSGLLFIVLYFLIIFIKIVEDTCMYKQRSLDKLIEGDWLVKDVLIKGKLIVKVRGLGLTKKDIQILKKYKVKSLLIKDGIPFVPGFLIGLIITIIIGSL